MRRSAALAALAVAVVAAVTDPAGWVALVMLAAAVAMFVLWQRWPALPAPVLAAGVPALALYRIAQEALHNAARHAPSASTVVAVTVTAAAAELEVTSAGPLAGRADHSRPHYGLIGMRERAATVGGQLQAGPTSQGWRVHARVPVTSA